MEEHILVVGGAGYIGSHVNKLLNKKGYSTIVYDNLSSGYKEFVKWGHFIEGDINDVPKLRKLFSKYNIIAVFNFAGLINVGESVSEPEKYYYNNLQGALSLLGVMNEYGCKNFIFSSSCAVYGVPEYLPLDEKHQRFPVNPYGRTKLMVEQALEDYGNAYGLKFVALRYFNASGADFEIELGEAHVPETHLIPLVLDAAFGLRDSIKVFGTDYNTKDGSAIRDYIHVVDLADAHLKAFEYLVAGGQSDFFNLGNGNGFTVFEIVETVEKALNIKIKKEYAPRRLGDPDILVGCALKAEKILSWKPEFDLKAIITTAIDWHKKKYRL